MPEATPPETPTRSDTPADASSSSPRTRRIGPVTVCIGVLVIGILALNAFKPIGPWVQAYRAGRQMAGAIELQLQQEYPHIVEKVTVETDIGGRLHVEADLASRTEVGDLLRAIVRVMHDHARPTVACRLTWPDHEAVFTMTSENPLDEFSTIMLAQDIDIRVTMGSCPHCGGNHGPGEHHHDHE